jgi:F0F1-type ATP synthase delta subunit
MTKSAIKIVSVVDIESDLKAGLEAKLKAKYGAERSFEYHLDPNILAGMVVQVDDMEYHYDLRDQIDFIFLELLK